MEQRDLLQPNTELRFYLKNGTSATYVIQSVQGVGSLCVLYSAYYLDNLGLKKSVKIKEYNPVKFHLGRKQSLFLEIPDYEQESFRKLKSRVVQSYHVSHQLFQTEHTANSISNAENIYEAYGTVYIVYAYMEGQDLAHYAVPSVTEAIRITKSVAKAVHKIHGAGYLYLDVKPENILILDGTTDLIQLFDFDSLIPVNEKDHLMEVRITFSKGFSPVEQRLGDLANIGKHSDVYSIGALLFYLLYGVAPKASDCNRRSPYRFEKSKFDFFHSRDILGKEIL